VQISHSVHAEIQKEDHIQQVQGKHCADTEGSVQMEGGRDHRGESAGGSYSFAGEHTTEVQYIELHGVSEGEECADDLGPACKLEYKYGNRHFWSQGYYVSTVGLNEARIAKYVREQETQDQMMDKISTKEYEDPFRGS
jgi:putative transposase